MHGDLPLPFEGGKGAPLDAIRWDIGWEQPALTAHRKHAHDGPQARRPAGLEALPVSSFLPELFLAQISKQPGAHTRFTQGLWGFPDSCLADGHVRKYAWKLRLACIGFNLASAPFFVLFSPSVFVWGGMGGGG